MTMVRPTALLVAALLCGWASAQVIEPYASDEHTLLLYHFDGEGEQIVDSGPLGLHGTLSQGPVERVEGVIGNALRLGQDQVIGIEGDRALLQGMDQLTIEVWFRTGPCLRPGWRERS